MGDASEHKTDRTDWPAGPWDNEPEDRISWTDAATGLPCLMVRGGGGAWCGYVAVAPGHPWHGKGSDEVPADVHGGLTYADACFGPICHVPAPGASDDVWWLGFDTSHAWDLRPADWRAYKRDAAGHVPVMIGEYRDVAYVRAEVTSLAAQAMARK